MSLTSPIKLNISQKLKNKEYFHKFFFLRTKTEIAEQIRGLRNEQGLKQAELANLTHMKQSAISRIEQSEYAGWNFKTLQRIAEALDVRMQVIFTPAVDVIREYEEKEHALSLAPSKEYAAPSSVMDAIKPLTIGFAPANASGLEGWDFFPKISIEDARAKPTQQEGKESGTYRDITKPIHKAVSSIQPDW